MMPMLGKCDNSGQLNCGNIPLGQKSFVLYECDWPCLLCDCGLLNKD